MFESNTIVGSAGKVMDFIVTKAVALNNAETATFSPGLLFVGVAGDIKVTPMNATAATYVTFKNIAKGTFFPMYIKGIHSDTTATDMLICY